VRSRDALPFFTRFYVASPRPAACSVPKACSRQRVASECSRSRKFSEFGARAGDNDNLVFVTSDSISIFLVTIESSSLKEPVQCDFVVGSFVVR